MLLGERAKQDIDGPRRPFRAFAGAKLQNPVGDSHRYVRRNHVQVIGLQNRPFHRRLDRNFGFLRQNFCQKTLMPGIEVLHQQKSHPGCGRQLREQFRDGLQPSGRSADSNDGEGPIRGFHQRLLANRIIQVDAKRYPKNQTNFRLTVVLSERDIKAKLANECRKIYPAQVVAVPHSPSAVARSPSRVAVMLPGTHHSSGTISAVASVVTITARMNPPWVYIQLPNKFPEL